VHLQVKEAEPQNSHLHWLDVGDKYLTEDGAKLNPALVFDGTHMAPAFLQYVNAALEGILAGQ